MADSWRQVSILHLSDLHFDAVGSAHRFRPGVTPSGDFAEEEDFPSLAGALIKDLRRRRRDHPVLLAVTGDLTDKASAADYAAAETFLRDLTSAPVLGRQVSLREVFTVPGNHDVGWDKTGADRWAPYCAFRRSLFGEDLDPVDPDAMTRLHDRSADLGLLVVEVNSSVFVAKGTADAERGRISTAALKRLDDALTDVAGVEAIRIVLMHHHPVLLPAFGEPSRGYDSIINGGKLLSILRKHGFHVVLHGHKHYPFTFSYDASCPWLKSAPPMLILAGGSASARELPLGVQAASNTYNELTIKWHPSAGDGRVRVATRKLVTFDETGEELLPQDWRWVALRTTYHSLRASPRVPRAGKTRLVPFKQGRGVTAEKKRRELYETLRGNMPVAEITPSMDSTEGYDARVWIEPHKRLRKQDIPVQVEWSCGPQFRLACCQAPENPNFAVTLSYHGPMLVQARLLFSDGSRAAGYVYLRIPGRSAARGER